METAYEPDFFKCHARAAGRCADPKKLDQSTPALAIAFQRLFSGVFNALIALNWRLFHDLALLQAKSNGIANASQSPDRQLNRRPKQPTGRQTEHSKQDKRKT